MYEFWYNYVKQKYGENGKFCYMDRESSIVHVKTEDIYKRIYTSNFELERPMPNRKNKKVIGLTKD